MVSSCDDADIVSVPGPLSLDSASSGFFDHDLSVSMYEELHS